MNWLHALLASCAVLVAADALAADVRIVSWNVAADPFESVQARVADYKNMADTLQPDVIAPKCFHLLVTGS